ncbi:hypothetical protein, partial [uncultured Candidatus Kuenenia sp.]|uniref:hypothetical protein n=1 Tax=uncultured Candidatus Kuenenia sp. TaxID=1048336 RepID=UPI0025EF6939
FIEMVNLLSGVFCYQYTAEYLGNPTISILFLQQGFALFAGFRNNLFCLSLCGKTTGRGWCSPPFSLWRY